MAAATQVTIQDVQRLGLRVATIESVQPHPNANRLYVLTVRLGEERRTLVAGIREAYTAEELPGKRIVVVTNLLPATIRGVTSEGMLLAAADEATLALITPDRPVASGSPIR